MNSHLKRLKRIIFSTVHLYWEPPLNSLKAVFAGEWIESVFPALLFPCSARMNQKTFIKVTRDAVTHWVSRLSFQAVGLGRYRSTVTVCRRADFKLVPVTQAATVCLPRHSNLFSEGSGLMMPGFWFGFTGRASHSFKLEPLWFNLTQNLNFNLKLEVGCRR